MNNSQLIPEGCWFKSGSGDFFLYFQRKLFIFLTYFHFMEFKYGTLLIVWGVMIGIYLLLKILYKPDSELDKELKDILTSEEHKVKGQHN
jgi:hypothetical protein